MEFLAKVNPFYFAAIAGFAAIRDVRFYLCGVYIEPYPGGGVMIVATDGRVMGAIHDPHGYVREPIIVATPPKALVAACTKRHQKFWWPSKLYIGQRASVVTFGDSDEAPELFGTGTIATVQTSLVDGQYPEWIRPIPAKVEDGAPMPLFNSSFLKPFVNAQKILGAQLAGSAGVFLMPAGPEKPMVVRLDVTPEIRERFTGLIMPLQEATGRPNALLTPEVAALRAAYKPKEKVDV